MRRSIISILIACLAIAGPFASFPTGALDPLERATMDEAMTVAENWVDLIIEKTGDWGGASNASVVDCQELLRGDRTLGYYCSVRPQGYIVVSLYKGLAPAKFYSTTHGLDPESEEGMADLIKDVMERILDALGLQTVSGGNTPDVSTRANVVETDYTDLWDDLLHDSPRIGIRADYQEGGVLLTSHWDQGPPYNEQCPDMSCTHGGCPTNTRALVGCGGTALSLIAHHWCWPPIGEGGAPYTDAYDWANMLDDYAPCGAGATQASIDAVAELSYETGLAAQSTYGCGATFTTLYWMRDAIVDHFRYHSSATRLFRKDYTTVDWFNLMKAELNQNRPLPYAIENHFIVVDGWRETGPTPTREIHINYGHGGDHDDDDNWYTLEGTTQIPGADWPDWEHEQVVIDLYPAQSLGHSLSGTYGKSTFNYRYFDRDTSGSCTFSAGQFLQFLPGIAVTSTGTIRFYGSAADSTRLFTGGDTTRGIRIYGGAIRLNNNGGITLP